MVLKQKLSNYNVTNVKYEMRNTPDVKMQTAKSLTNNVDLVRIND